MFFCLHLISILMGLFVRLLYIVATTIISLLFSRCLSNYMGWLHQYINVVRNASTPNKIKLFCYVICAIILSYGLLSFGQYQLTCLFIKIYSPFLDDFYYWDLVIRNFFIIEFMFYILCRTRCSLKYCPLYSTKITLLCVSYSIVNPVKLSSFIIHFHLFAHLLLFTVFALIEKTIVSDEFCGDYQPSFKKPRMLFYLGFDLDWHKSIPPIWTYFMNWYDWTYVGEKERVYLEGEYQLLYGRLLGMD